MYKLVRNEVIKAVYKKRLYLIFGILLILVILFAYGQHFAIDKNKEQLAKRIGISQEFDWKKLTEQQIINQKHRLDSAFVSENEKAAINVRIAQLQYSIDHNINPIDSNAAKFASNFMEQAIFMFIPLLMIMLAADMVSGEASSGTIKLLLTRAVPRWKILLSKLIALVMLEFVVMAFALLSSIIVSGLFFGYSGWMEPVTVGFKVLGGKLDSSSVINLPQWQNILLVYSLSFYVALVIGSISFMVSVLVKSTSASIGIMMSTLVGGTFLSFFLSDWDIVRYFFMVNLRLTEYLSGNVQPIAGVNMTFSVLVLAGWAIASLIVSFVRFTKQDILV
ncbi:MAG: ABC transporter permease subunit [Vallitaleaceae bacterium]|nr:ABC transporter permease subunit [Vallitaleaceae bacterium]